MTFFLPWLQIADFESPFFNFIHFFIVKKSSIFLRIFIGWTPAARKKAASGLATVKPHFAWLCEEEETFKYRGLPNLDFRPFLAKIYSQLSLN